MLSFVFVVLSFFLPSNLIDGKVFQPHHELIKQAKYVSACPPDSLIDRNNVTNLLRTIHLASSPALAAGNWVCDKSSSQHNLSHAHLQCLNMELQGNCYNYTFNLVGPKQSRIASLNMGSILNSADILQGRDSCKWESTLEEYKALGHNPKFIRQLVEGRKIFLIGDSLTRQWTQLMHCEFVHSLGMTVKEAAFSVRFLWANRDFTKSGHLTKKYDEEKDEYVSLEKAILITLKDFLRDATSSDYIVWNLGHHYDRGKLGDNWKYIYQNALLEHSGISFGKVPFSNVFFRTTAVRHFKSGKTDFESNNTKRGGSSPNLTAVWSDFGGKYPAQPQQNLLAIETLCNYPISQILDVSPMMLARADATFDGSHFCLPGPMNWWSRMLYYRILRNSHYKHD
jgi:hypothetical protein